MSLPLLTLRTDGIGVPGSEAKAPIERWVSCEYGDALDAAEACILVLDYLNPALEQMIVRDVIYLRNEIGEFYEYRIKKIEEQLDSPTIRITATPLLHDLNDILVTTIGLGGETPYVSAVYPASGWWDFIIDEVLARYGITHWQRGTFDLVDDIALTLDAETILGLLRRLVSGTTYTLRSRYSGGVYYVDITEVVSSSTPVIIVGENVVALESTVNTDSQVTRVYPKGQPYDDGTPSNIGSTPWVIGAGSGLSIEIIDPEYATADFAIEDDQYAPRPAADFDGFAMVASRGTEINVVPATGSSTRWTEAVCGAKRRIFVPIQNATGEVHAYDYATEAWLTAITVGGVPIGICYAPSNNKVFVATGSGNSVKVIDPDTNTLTATISIGVAVYHLLYVESVDRVFACTASGLVAINPSTNVAGSPVSGGTGSTILYQVVVVGTELWGTSGGAAQYLKRFSLLASPAYVSEYDVGLVSGAGPDTICYDETNDRVWISYWTGNNIKVITRLTGATHTTFNTGSTPNAGPPRWMYAFEGTVYSTHNTGRIARWNGATPAYVSVTTVDASGGEYWAMSPLAPGESSVMIAGVGKRLAWWDLSTHSARVIRRIAGVTAGSPSLVEFGGGTSVPFATGDVTTLVTLDLLPVTSLPSPVAIEVYGEIQRPLTFDNERLVPNLVGHPALDEWKVEGTTMANWDLPSPVAIGLIELDSSVSLGLAFSASGTATAL